MLRFRFQLNDCLPVWQSTKPVRKRDSNGCAKLGEKCTSFKKHNLNILSIFYSTTFIIYFPYLEFVLLQMRILPSSI